MTAVQEKFGADDHRRYMKQFLALKQRGSVEEYQLQFEKLSYQISMQNPHYDEQFFISQFIKGLKTEIRGAVEAQVPDNVERAILLAVVQQEVLADSRKWGQRQGQQQKGDSVMSRNEVPRPALKMGDGTLWKDRQLRDYHRANRLCFKCGDKYEPSHQCGKKPNTELHLAQTEPTPEQLTDEILNMLEIQDIANAEERSISVHALDGTEGAKTLRLRALIGNQVLLILVDSGSTDSFLNANMLDRIQCKVSKTEPIAVKLADGKFMQCDQMVNDLGWWCQGETFITNMRVLELGAYDEILGMDWLQQHSPMVTDWQNHCLAFQHKNKFIRLQGVLAPPQDNVRELRVEKFLKWYKGTEVWVVAMIKPETETQAVAIPAAIQAVLADFSDVFATPTNLPPQ
uniref:Uncharacterized protein n=1 Tax=Avena sativa TaxID=4498 RepID=A0ACD5Y7R2_AVESA